MIVIFYILGFYLISAAIFPIVRKGNGIFTTILFFCAFVCALLFSINAPDWQETFELPWFRSGKITFQITIISDTAIRILLPFITLIGALVSLYSVSYFKGNEHHIRYFSVLSLFMFSMTGLIISGNLLLSFFCWELVGICSYLLIGFYREKQSAGIAATKALIINKLGDIGFLIAILTLAAETGSFGLSVSVKQISEAGQYIISIGLLTAVVAKSAQFPLHTWLPDAMAGPSPVSALIHSATMVAAGIYLLFRTQFLFPSEVLFTGSILGMFTAFVGGWNALFENKIKQLLAWSTISQLGLMMMSVSIGSPGAALMHLVSHGFFKAGLFLSAGYLLKSSNNAEGEDLKWISNTKGGNRVIAFSIIIFSLGLIGLPLSAAFISKEAMASQLPSFAIVPFFVITAMTIIYTVRFIIFMLPYYRSSNKKSLDGYTITVLALVLFSGWWIWSPLPFRAGDYFNLSQSGSHELTLFSAIFILITGIIAFVLLTKQPDLFKKISIYKINPDPMYRILILTPVIRVSEVAGKADRAIIDSVIHAVAYIQVIIAHLVAAADRYIVDGIARMITILVAQIGKVISSVSRGNVQSYLWWALSILILLLIILS